ncbi:MAG: gamma-glutamyltransferase, partial [Pseudomonadota bacterium]
RFAGRGDGVALNAFQAHLNGLVRPILTASPEVEELFAPAAEPGALRKNPDLADVLEVFAAEGPRFFTEGEVGQALLSLPGQVLTAGDLTRATGIWRKPLRTYCGHAEVSLNPAPSLGGVLIAMALNLAPTDAGPAEIAAAFEAVARARVDLALDQAADPEAVGLDPHLLRDLRKSLERKAATRGTTHISVIASDGSGAALTLSNGEGCGRLVPGTGIQPNNMLGEEDLNPAGPTGWTPQQRLASMMCPASLRQPDGALTLLGSGGSARIRTALPRVMRALVHGTPPEEAIALPRIHAEPGRIDFEDIGGEAFRAAILDHFPEATPWPEPSMFFGGVHIAQAGPNGARAAGDPRRAGAAETS